MMLPSAAFPHLRLIGKISMKSAAVLSRAALRRAAVSGELSGGHTSGSNSVRTISLERARTIADWHDGVR